MKTNRVFLYGTLKGGNATRGINKLGNARFIGVALTKGYWDMYNLGAFPAIIPNGVKKVRGEIWEVDEELMNLLDYIEGYPDMYNRKVIKTDLGEAWAYYMDSADDFYSAVKMNTIGELEWKENYNV